MGYVGRKLGLERGPFRYYDRRARRWRRGDRARARVVPRKGLARARRPAVYAHAYVQLGAFSSPALALLYSVDSMTTRGSGALPIAPHWAMMGATEAGNGMLLFGISTAFLFALMHDLWRSHLLND